MAEQLRHQAEQLRHQVDQSRHQVDAIKEQHKQADEEAQLKGIEDSVEGGAENIAMEVTGDLADELDDVLFFPFDLIAPVGENIVKSAIPGAVATMMTNLSHLFLCMPFSGLFHTLLIDILPLYLFYLSTYSALGQVFQAGVKAHKSGENFQGDWAGPDESAKCLDGITTHILWLQLAAAKSPGECFEKSKVDDPGELNNKEKTGVALLAYVNMMCFLLCASVWLIVIGNFFYRNECHVSVQSGAYFKNSFLAKRSKLYRFVAGLIGLGCILGIGAVFHVAHRFNVLGTIIQTMLPTVIAAVLTAKPILTPTKPKFEYTKGLDKITFKRSSFFLPNGSFSRILGDALMQCTRNPQNHNFNKKLKGLLANPAQWEEVWRMCLVTSLKEDSNNTLPNLLARADDALTRANDGLTKLDQVVPFAVDTYQLD